MKDFKVITVVSNDLNQIWQVNAYLENLKSIEWSQKTDVLVFCLGNKKPQWEIVEKLYPETRFFFYMSDKLIKNLIPIYLPIIRPFALRQHFKQNIELQEKTIVYTDADILWTKQLNLDSYGTDSYVSSTVFPSDYQSHKYLLSKRDNVDPDKLGQYDELDIIQILANIAQITKEQIINNYENCGGVQYILNDIDWQFWEKVMVDCLGIRVEMQTLNQSFMKGSNAQERENNGFQSWCADLWAVFYNLLYRNQKVSAPKELDFAWATDKIDKLEDKILHNAGVTSDSVIRTTKRSGDGVNREIEAPAFYKGKYIKSTPFTDIENLKKIANHPISREYCTSLYTNHLISLQEKYGLNY